MNEDSREEGTVLGKALNIAVVGGAAYGTHKGLTSDKTVNWAYSRSAQKGGDTVATKGIKYYNDKVNQKKDEILRRRAERKYGNSSYVNVDWSPAGDTPTSYGNRVDNLLSESPNAGNLLNASPNDGSMLKEGLSPDALERQKHLEHLKNGGSQQVVPREQMQDFRMHSNRVRNARKNANNGGGVIELGGSGETNTNRRLNIMDNSGKRWNIGMDDISKGGTAEWVRKSRRAGGARTTPKVGRNIIKAATKAL